MRQLVSSVIIIHGGKKRFMMVQYETLE